MNHPITTLQTRRTRLVPGQALRLHLDRHATLVVDKGAVVVIAPPLWLVETMLAARTRLDEGQAFSPSRAGWMEVVAVGDAPVELVRYGEAGATLAARWRGLVAPLSQRMRALRGFS